MSNCQFSASQFRLRSVGVPACPPPTASMAMPPGEVADADSVMEDATMPMTKGAVTSKIFNFLSDVLVPAEEGGYKKTLPFLFQAAWGQTEQQVAFKRKLETWEVHLRDHGHRVLSDDHITHVPVGAVREFYVRPWQLSFDAAVSVKGAVSKWFCD